MSRQHSERITMALPLLERQRRVGKKQMTHGGSSCLFWLALILTLGVGQPDAHPHIGGRPERTQYSLTADGEKEYQALLRATWWKVAPPLDELMGRAERDKKPILLDFSTVW